MELTLIAEDDSEYDEEDGHTLQETSDILQEIEKEIISKYEPEVMDRDLTETPGNPQSITYFIKKRG